MAWTDPLVIIFGVAALALVAIVALAVLPSTPAFRQLVTGALADPTLVGLMRGLLFYVVPLALGGALAWVGGWTDPRLLPLVPLAGGLIRWAEGRFDRWQKPQQNAVNPPPVAGGGDRGLIT
jgi:hypothetical protein